MKKALLLTVVAATLGFGGVLPQSFHPIVPMVAVAQAAQLDEITATGYGSMPVGMPLGRAKLMARRAAIMDAQRNLIEEIKGAAVDAESTMENFVVTSDYVRTKVNGMITGAKIVSENQERDGSYVVVMSVPAYGVGSVAEAAITQKLANEGIAAPKPLPAPTPAAVQTYNPAPQAQVAGGYTGIVIDARGTNLVRTFCPVIYDTNGRAIYGVHNVDKDYAISQGIVEYAEGPERWQAMGIGNTRAGSNPLIVKLVSLRERCANKCDVVISVEDADKILIENQRSGMLNRYNVVFGK